MVSGLQYALAGTFIPHNERLLELRGARLFFTLLDFRLFVILIGPIPLTSLQTMPETAGNSALFGIGYVQETAPWILEQTWVSMR